MMSVPIGVGCDITSPIPVSIHQYAGPVVPPPPFVPTVELPAGQAWPPGAATMQHKLTRKTFAMGQPIVQSGHDCGALIVHISIPWNNVLTAVQIPMSKRKSCFDVPTVKYEGTASAAFPAPFMLICGDPVSLPGTTFPGPQTVMVGMTMADLWRGVLQIVVTVLIDLLFFCLANPKGPKPTPATLFEVFQQVFKKTFGFSVSGKGFGLSMAKIGLSAVTKFLVDASMQVDNPTLKARAGHPLLGMQVSVGRDGDGVSVDTECGNWFEEDGDGTAAPDESLGRVL